MTSYGVRGPGPAVDTRGYATGHTEASPIFQGTGVVRRYQPASVSSQASEERWDAALPHDQLLGQAEAVLRPEPGPIAEPQPAARPLIRRLSLDGFASEPPRAPSADICQPGRPLLVPLSEAPRPRPHPMDSASALAGELDQLELQEQAVWQRMVDRVGDLAGDLAGLDEQLGPRWAATCEDVAGRAERLRAEQLTRLLYSPTLMDGYWREKFRAQEQQWQARLAGLQSQLEVARRRTQRFPTLSPRAGRGPPTEGSVRCPSPARPPVAGSVDGDASFGSPHSGLAADLPAPVRLGMEVAEGEGGEVVVVQARGASLAAGVRPGDVVKVVRLVTPTPHMAAYRQALASLRPGARVVLSVLRAGEERRITVIT